MDSIISISDQLSKIRDSVENIPEHLGSGIYAIFAKNLDCLAEFTIPSSGVIYIGISNRLELRNHFKAKYSGFSTIRRSIGAILKNELNLSAEPRSKGNSETNYRDFRFTGNGEKCLSLWMQSNLEYSIVDLEGDLIEIETCLISQNEPPLNLTKYENYQKKRIRHLRNQCKEEAKKIWECNHLAKR
ncbi:MAG: hypothetical protein OXI60_01815 [Acidiferrobacterales bacterium]|nr:hypothetical protein [Acidiferrobacterales bacterium]